jgi:cellulose synthase/poly-beta-1,6-N-acetylglucosamine synthase-like glycosyltransferase
MPDSLPTVSIVIPAYNAAGCLGECLVSIRGLQYPSDKMEVLVVDNNSADSTSAVACEKGFEPLLCIRTGASAARNTGIEKATGEIVAFTDSDVVVEPDWLLRLVEAFRDPEVGGVGGAIEAYRAVTGSEFHAVVWGMLNQERQLAGRLPHMLPFAATANAAYRASALREVKGFDETLGVGEDADLSWRVQWAGYKMAYAPAAKVRHKFRSTRKAYFRQTYEYGKATVDLFKKHHRRLGLRVWIEWPHLRTTVWTLARVPIMPFIGRTPWDRVAPLYDLIVCLAWLAGRIVRSVQHGVLVI